MSPLLRALVILMFGILIIQLINLQVIKGDEYKQRAEINALREVPVPAARGLIYDRNGTPAGPERRRFTATIVPGDLPERGEDGVYRMTRAVTRACRRGDRAEGGRKASTAGRVQPASSRRHRPRHAR